MLSERAEALRIAQIYQSEIDRTFISEQDILHLQATVKVVLDILNNFGAPISDIEKFKELISVDTLKAMQLLGFNYKAAIGEPLTQICAEAITGLNKKRNSNSQNKKSK